MGPHNPSTHEVSDMANSPHDKNFGRKSNNILVRNQSAHQGKDILHNLG